MIDPERLSQYEFCPTYERLYRTVKLERLPVRDGIKRYFAQGIAELQRGNRHAPLTVSEAFLKHAASEGFIYPSDNWQNSYGNHVAADVYTLANDYCSWLEGALAIAQEVMMPGETLWRVVERFESRVRWSELLASTKGDCTAHYFRLPALRNGRLQSPLNLAYKHPMTGGFRVHGKTTFSNNYKRVARWEIGLETTWEEWREWIERDDALPLCYQEKAIEAIGDPKAILADAAAIEQAIESAVVPPKHRESCDRGCVFKSLCHPASL